MKHLDITIYGNVQGVSFRYYTTFLAKKLGINGFVLNNQDGTVYIEAEGKKDVLDEFLKWRYQWPNGAKIEKVIIKSGKLKGYEEFETRI